MCGLKAALANDIKSVTVGINLDKLMRPTEVMLLSISDEPIRRKTMFERLFRKDKKAEPLSEIYARKYKDGQVVEVDKKLFSELDSLCCDYVRRANSANIMHLKFIHLLYPFVCKKYIIILIAHSNAYIIRNISSFSPTAPKKRRY